MQEVAGRSLTVEIFPAARSRGAMVPARRSAVSLWRETLLAFNTHAAPILAYALFGLVGANLIGAIFSTALLLNAYFINGAYTPYTNILYPQLLIQGILGSFMYTFARGAITWIALQGQGHHGQRPGARDAFRATARRLPVLLAQSLLYGALITAGTLGLTLLLRELRLDVSNIGRVNGDLGDMSRAAAIRGLGGLLPDPGAPFSEIYSFTRYTLSRTAFYTWYLNLPATLSAPAGLWLAGISGALLIVTVETLARLRVVMAMRDSGPGRLAGLADSARAGWRHFGFITAQVWLLRFLTLGVGGIFTVAPMTFLQSIFVPTFARVVGSFWPYPFSTILFALGATMVNMLLLAFATVFDTRIAAALREPAPARQPASSDRLLAHAARTE
jgi:hypothetical protein